MTARFRESLGLLPRRVLVGAVRLYRLLLSPWLGNACRFEPTCSVYAIGALQRHGAVAGFMEKGLAHCRDNNIDPAEIVETRLFPDMAPFRFQIQSVAHHSFGAVEAVKAGVFNPPAKADLPDYASLQKLVADARAGLEAMKSTDVNALEGKDVSFQFRDTKLPFVAEAFLLSFSLPNFHFHATTAYDILRHKGVPLGKRDYMGKMKLAQ